MALGIVAEQVPEIRMSSPAGVETLDPNAARRLAADTVSSRDVRISTKGTTEGADRFAKI